ncbi:MAG: TraR/DksA C4-type zinc finger protein [Promethearchaeota archaeon]
MHRDCINCGEPIHKRRLELVPDTKYCVECQEDTGDVQRYLGIREKVGTKHLGGCDGNVIKDRELIKKFHSLLRKQRGRYPA